MWSYILVEFVAFALFIACSVAAFKRGPWDLSFFFTSGVYGLLVELMFVHVAQGYEYGEFLAMVKGAPLWVAAGWAVIIYICTRSTEDLSKSLISASVGAGLAAVTMDFALDPVAEGEGWWHWKRASDFFGVSYDNFVGWITIVSSFSLVARFKDTWWMPLAALPVSVIFVGLFQLPLEWSYGLLGEGPVFMLLFTVACVTAFYERIRAAGLVRLAVPVVMYGLFVGVAVGTALTVIHPELYGVFALAIGFGTFWATIPGVTDE